MRGFVVLLRCTKKDGMITTEHIKKLRDETGVSIMQCKKALEEAGGDHGKALILLRKQSGAFAEKKAGREFAAGVVQAYVHNTNAVATLVVLACETDFVAKNEEFIRLARELAMQVAATNPTYLSVAEITDEVKAKAKEVFAAEAADKPTDLREKILNGKLDAYFKELVLLEQPYIKNPEVSVRMLIDTAVQKFGERIAITKFVRLSTKA